MSTKRSSLTLDWDRYKLRCDAPDTFTRWMLQETLSLLDPDSAAARGLSATLSETPLEKPVGHRGDERTDIFVLSLAEQDVRGIIDVVVAARNSGTSTPDTQTRGLGGFEEAWRELLQHLKSDVAS